MSGCGELIKLRFYEAILLHAPGHVWLTLALTRPLYVCVPMILAVGRGGGDARVGLPKPKTPWEGGSYTYKSQSVCKQVPDERLSRARSRVSPGGLVPSTRTPYKTS